MPFSLEEAHNRACPRCAEPRTAPALAYGTMSGLACTAAREPVSLGRRISQLAAEDPTRPALVIARPDPSADEVVSRLELDRLSTQAARRLARDGVTQGALLVVALPNGLDHVVVSLAGMKLGATVLPLRWDQPDWERSRLLAAVSPAAIVRSWDREAAASESIEPLPDAVAERPFAIGTGGSTGVPKIVLVPAHGALVPGEAHDLLYQLTSIGPGARHIVAGPLDHSNAFMLLHHGLFDAHTDVLLERFDAATWVAAVERHAVEFGSLVPTMMRRILAVDGLDAHRLRSLRTVFHTGAPCSVDLKRRWIDLVGPERLVEAFGSTEAIGLITIRGDEWLAHPGSIGRPFLTEVRILDADGEEARPGHVGQLYMRTVPRPDICFSYLNGPPPPELPGGFVTVGDLAWRDAEGWLYCADRRDDLIISGGANIYPAEVEAALVEHPLVQDVAVVGLPDEDWGQAVHAVVQAPPDARDPTSVELDAFVRSRVASYKAPKGYTIVSELPRDAMGKVRKSDLVARVLERA
jgi:bile acid-coenzyme A ligase